jgi:hypothetical protein
MFLTSLSLIYKHYFEIPSPHDEHRPKTSKPLFGLFKIQFLFKYIHKINSKI